MNLLLIPVLLVLGLIWLALTWQERRRPRTVPGWGPPLLQTPSMRALERMLEGTVACLKWGAIVVFWLGVAWVVNHLRR